MKILLAFAILYLATLVPGLAQAKTESEYVQEWCTGAIEYRLEDRTRVDCLTEEYAIEADYARKWAEAVGQSLYYAEMTGLKPGILIILGEDETRYLERLITTIQATRVKVRVWITGK
jgi:hypothetical protein